jgi:hypothetical protein
MAIYRNEDGFSALPASDPLADLDIGNPRKWAVYFDDFLHYDKTQLIGGYPYTLTQTNGVDTIVGPTGVLVLTLGGADNDAAQLQTVEAPFQTNSKRLYFEARVKIDLAGGTMAANEIVIGLASLQATTNFMAADGLSMTADDFLGFRSFDADASADAVMREADAESTDQSVWTPVDGEWDTLGIYYTGSEAKFYVNQGLVATITGNDTTSIVAPVLYLKAGGAQANILNCDYIMVAAER